MKNKHSRQTETGFEWEVASIPLVGGVDLRSNKKLRPTERLTELNNGRFVERFSIGKRAGHVASILRSDIETVPPPETNDMHWVFGLGWLPSSNLATASLRAEQHQAKGVFTLNGTLVAWTGDRLLVMDDDTRTWYAGAEYSTTDEFFLGPSLQSLGHFGVFPTSKERTLSPQLGKTPHYQASAKGLNHELFAWRSGTEVYITVKEIGTETTVVQTKQVTSVSNDPEHVVAFYLDHQLITMWNDATTDELFWVRYSDVDGSLQAEAVFQADVVAFDYSKYDDNTAICAWMQADFVMKVKAFDGSGSVTTWLSAGTVVVPTNAPTQLQKIAVAVADDRSFVVEWCSGVLAAYTLRARAYDSAGVALAAEMSIRVFNTTVPTFSVVANKDVNPSSGHYVFLTASSADVSGSHVLEFRALHSGGTYPVETKHATRLVGKLFAVGSVSLIPVLSRPRSASPQPVQSNYYLLACTQTPESRVCGLFCRGEAAGTPGGPGGAEVSWFSGDFLPGQGFNKTKWFATFSEREGNYTQDGGGVTNSIETKIRVCDIDFLPPLRWAQAGQASYIAGAMPQTFDGQRVVEAGFHEYPEIISSLPGASGSLTALGVYRYRAYFCRKNAAGEIYRSPSITYTAPALVGNDLTLTITTLPCTSDPDVYYELYRTEANGTTFYLVSGYNPHTAAKNSFAANTITILDTLSDATIRTMPVDPFTKVTASELEETGPPGCEGIAYINDRLWIYGGSIECGKLVYSKNMEIGEGVGFNDQGVLEYSVDRTGKPITAVGSISSIPIIFRDTDVFAIAGDGPDNFGLSTFALPRFLAADLGAVSHEGVVSCPEGLAFLSAVGPRIVTPQLSITSIGDEIYPLLADFECTGSVQVPKDGQVRWYGRGQKALVWDYVIKQWSVYTGLACEGVCLYNKQAALARADGTILLEEEGQWTDGGNSYEFSLTTADLRPADLVQGATRWRRWALLGDWEGPHTLLVEIWKNGSSVLAERFYWNPATNLGLDIFGSGSGTFGVSGSSTWPDDSDSDDGVYRARRRFKATTQKASLIRIRFSDNGCQNNSFVLSELALELGVKAGLARLPKRTFTNTP